MRLPNIQPKHFQVYVDWSYTDKLVVEDDATAADSGMDLTAIYLAGEFLDDVKLRNIATRQLNTLVLAHESLFPRVIRLIWENTTTSSSLRQWTVDTAILNINKKRFAHNAARYPAEFMSAMALGALQKISPVTRSRQEPAFTRLLPNYLEPEVETAETAT